MKVLPQGVSTGAYVTDRDQKFEDMGFGEVRWLEIVKVFIDGKWKTEERETISNGRWPVL